MGDALPPILVNRKNMRVIDGMHRVRAAILNGHDAIAVEFFNGDDAEAFVRAVTVNISHGLPLTLTDRRAAAARIIAEHPDWSDRAIAMCTGLCDKTVATVRSRSTADDSRLNRRLGRDGRLRPVRFAEGRQRASEVITAQPNASLREIARLAGISPATARDVRDRMRQGKDPVPAACRDTSPVRRTPPAGRESSMRVVGADSGDTGKVARDDTRDLIDQLQMLRNDPRLRFTDSGRNLLRWLQTQVTGTQTWENMVDNVPAHNVNVVADLASGCAEAWHEFAEELRKRARKNMA